MQVNNFFSHVEMERMLPGFNQYCRALMCLAQGHTRGRLQGSNPGPLDLESDALSLHHRPPI